MSSSATATLPARVSAIRREAEGVISLSLEPAEAGVGFPAFEPGAHLDLHLPAQAQGLVRSYSLCRPWSGQARYEVAVQLDRGSRGGSRWLHEQLREGALLPISAPRNHFRLDAQAPAVLVAGGIGITPLWCMAQQLVDAGRPVVLVYAARSRRQAAFADDIAALAGTGALQVCWHFDDDAGAPPDLPALLREAGTRAGEQAHWYACGPAPMLAAFEAHAAACLPAERVHLERFAAAPGAAAAAVAPAAGPQRLRCARSDKEVLVAEGQSVLDALLEAGVEVGFSCREGICGACETPVLAGEILHGDSVLSPRERAEGRIMMVCVSRPAHGELVLDC